jgi:hypothetical protein
MSFLQMASTFDEGGAKGMLLVNLASAWMSAFASTELTFVIRCSVFGMAVELYSRTPMEIVMLMV